MTTINLTDEQRVFLVELLEANEKRCRNRAAKVDSQKSARKNLWEADACLALINQCQDAAEGKSQ